MDKIQLSSMVYSGENNYKYFIGYKYDNHKIKPLRIMLPGENNYKYFIGYKYDNHKIKPLRIMLPKTSALCKNS